MEDGVVPPRCTRHTPRWWFLPLLCNVYLHRLDRQWQTRQHGRLVRYADDLVVDVATRQQAEDALAALTTMLGDLGLTLNASKTRIVHLEEGGEGFDFLGLPPSLGAGTFTTPSSRDVPRSLALGEGDAACPPQDVNSRAVRRRMLIPSK